MEIAVKYATLADGFTDGEDRIPSVKITKTIFDVAKRGRLKFAPVAVLIVLSSWPFFLNLLCRFVAPSQYISRLHAGIWLESFGLIDALMLYAAFTAWKYLSDHGSDMDSILSKSAKRFEVISWYEDWLNPNRQWLLPIFGAISSPLILGIVRNSVNQHVAVGLISYLLVSWTGFIGGNVLYWLWVIPGLPRQLDLAGNLNLRWYDPSSTPALRSIARALGLASVFILAGVGSIIVLGFVLPNLSTVKSLQVIVNTFYAVSIATTIRVAVYPMVWYYRIIVTKKNTTLDELESRIGEKMILEVVVHESSVREALALHNVVSAAKDFPFSTAAMVQYMAALIGAVAAFIVSITRHI